MANDLEHQILNASVPTLADRRTITVRVPVVVDDRGNIASRLDRRGEDVRVYTAQALAEEGQRRAEKLRPYDEKATAHKLYWLSATVELPEANEPETVDADVEEG